MHPYPTIIRYVAKNLTFIQPLAGEAPGIWRQWGRLPPSSRVPANPILAFETPLSTVENAPRALVREGYLEKIGAGRSTAYLRK